MRKRCETCARFACDVMLSDGRPMERFGLCAVHRKRVENDDLCNAHKLARWAKSGEIGRARLEETEGAKSGGKAMRCATQSREARLP